MNKAVDAQFIVWRDRAEAAEAALRLVEFRGHQGKCPLCAGWMMSAYGETPGKHTKDCLVGNALSAVGDVQNPK